MDALRNYIKPVLNKFNFAPHFGYHVTATTIVIRGLDNHYSKKSPANKIEFPVKTSRAQSNMDAGFIYRQNPGRATKNW